MPGTYRLGNRFFAELLTNKGWYIKTSYENRVYKLREGFSDTNLTSFPSLFPRKMILAGERVGSRPFRQIQCTSLFTYFKKGNAKILLVAS